MPTEHWLEEHHRVTDTERAVLAELAEGASDELIAELLGRHVRAVRATLHRFYERTSVTGAETGAEAVAEGIAEEMTPVSGPRRAVAWCSRHRECCLSVNSC